MPTSGQDPTVLSGFVFRGAARRFGDVTTPGFHATREANTLKREAFLLPDLGERRSTRRRRPGVSAGH
jgi:hypothetical protein